MARLTVKPVPGMIQNGSPANLRIPEDGLPTPREVIGIRPEAEGHFRQRDAFRTAYEKGSAETANWPRTTA